MKASTRLTEVLSESEQLAASSAAYVDASLTGEGTAAPDDAPDTRKILIREPQSALTGRDIFVASPNLYLGCHNFCKMHYL